MSLPLPHFDPTRVINLLGPAGSGKSTLANAIVRRRPGIVMSYADIIYSAVSRILEIPVAELRERKREPALRSALQLTGDVIRNYDPDRIRNATWEAIFRYQLRHPDHIVVTDDIRFLHELGSPAAKTLNVYIQASNQKAPPASTHRSELDVTTLTLYEGGYEYDVYQNIHGITNLGQLAMDIIAEQLDA